MEEDFYGSRGVICALEQIDENWKMREKVKQITSVFRITLSKSDSDIASIAAMALGKVELNEVVFRELLSGFEHGAWPLPLYAIKALREAIPEANLIYSDAFIRLRSMLVRAIFFRLSSTEETLYEEMNSVLERIDIGEESLSLLLKNIEDKNCYIREISAYMLSKVGGKIEEIVLDLLKLLSDKVEHRTANCNMDS